MRVRERERERERGISPPILIAFNQLKPTVYRSKRTYSFCQKLEDKTINTQKDLHQLISELQPLLR
jgi:hypothetical protein